MRVSAVLIDIDGVLTVSWQPLPGAVAALRWLRAAGLPLALVTNTTSRPRASIATVLAEAGFPVSAADILTAPGNGCHDTVSTPSISISTALTRMPRP